MPNNIAAIKKYTTILDRVYQREATSSCLNSPARMARAGRNAKEIMIPKVSMTGFGTSSELIESRATQHVRRPSSPICCCMRFSISLNTCLRTAELPQTSSTWSRAPRRRKRHRWASCSSCPCYRFTLQCPRVPPIRSMRPASLRDALALHLSLTLANRSRYLFCCHDWIRLDCIENSSLGHRQRLCPNDITDTITDIPDICSASWTADLVARLVPLAAPRWFHVVAHQNDVQVNPSRYSRPWRCSGRFPS